MGMGVGMRLGGGGQEGGIGGRARGRALLNMALPSCRRKKGGGRRGVCGVSSRQATAKPTRQ